MNKKRTKPAAVKVVRDNTPSKKAALRESTEQFRGLSEDMPALICQFLPDYTISYVNRAYCDHFGRSADELVGTSFLALIPESDRDAVKTTISSLTVDAPVVSHEHQVLMPDKTVGLHKWINRALFDHTGRIVGYQSIGEDITESKRAEKALQESEEKYRKVFHTNQDSININRLADGMYIMINDGFTKITGYTEADIAGKTSIEINIWENQADRKRLVEGLKRDGVVKNLEANFQKKDGAIVRGLMSASVITMDGIPHIFSVTRDVSEQKRAEDALRESEEKYRNIFNNSIEGIFQTTPAGRYRTINRAFAAMFGYESPGEMTAAVTNIGEQLYVNPEDRKKLVVLMEESRGMVRDFEVQLIRKDGSLFWVSINARMVYNEKEGSTFIEGTCMDITSRKLAEDSLRLSEEQFRTLSEAAFEAIAIHEEGILINANDQYFKMFGYEPDEAIGKEMISVTFTPESLEIVRRKIAKNETGTYEAIGIRKDGTRFPMEIRVRKMEYKGRNVRIGTILDITERKKAYEELRKSEERHRTILSTAMDGFFVTDFAGRFVEVNETYCRMSGYTEEELLRLSVNYVEDVETAAATSAHLQKVMAQGQDRFESRHRRKDGSVFDVEISVQHRPADEPQLVVFVHDITARKRAEVALRESERKLADTIEFLPDATLAIDRDKRIIVWNKAIEEMTGIPAAEMIGQGDYAYTVPFYGERRPQLMDLVFEDLAETVVRYPSITREGDTLTAEVFCHALYSGKGAWVFAKASPLYDASGQIIGAIESIRDITNLKQAEDALRESEARKRSYFEQAPYGVFIANNNGEYLEVNSKACELTGYSEKELTKMSIPDLLIAEDLERGINHFEKVKESGSAYGESRYRTKDGAIRWWSVAGVNLSNDLLLGFCADITERRQVEEEKSKLESQLFQSQKMEAIGTLAGGIAHDFNNILSVIIGYTELARDRSQKENKEKYLQEVLMGAERARNLVKQILTFSRQEGHEKKPLDIKVLLKEALKFLRASIPVTIEIDQHIADEDFTILADPTQMHQVIMNLCTNASHAMKETGGTLKIELTSMELHESEHPELKPGHYVKLTVSDTGYGIDPAFIQRIFDPFFTTKAVDEGTGLGLSVVYGIVKSHNGVINVDSEQGKGATFHVYLPLIIQTETKEIDAGKLVIGGTERILFVDDEPALVDIGTRMLFPLGYHVTGAASSQEALDMFLAEPQRFDLIITDMTLPKMTGIDLSREMLKIRPDIPIILCSGIKEPYTEVQAKFLGIKAYLTKPLTRRELAGVVREVLGGREKR